MYTAPVVELSGEIPDPVSSQGANGVLNKLRRITIDVQWTSRNKREKFLFILYNYGAEQNIESAPLVSFIEVLSNRIFI